MHKLNLSQFLTTLTSLFILIAPAFATSNDADDECSKVTMLAPMPGKPLNIYVQAGQKVSKGEELLCLGAMKMEHTVRSEMSGTVEEIYCQAGSLVELKSPIISIIPTIDLAKHKPPPIPTMDISKLQKFGNKQPHQTPEIQQAKTALQEPANKKLPVASDEPEEKAVEQKPNMPPLVRKGINRTTKEFIAEIPEDISTVEQATSNPPIIALDEAIRNIGNGSTPTPSPNSPPMVTHISIPALLQGLGSSKPHSRSSRTYQYAAAIRSVFPAHILNYRRYISVHLLEPNFIGNLNIAATKFLAMKPLSISTLEELLSFSHTPQNSLVILIKELEPSLNVLPRANYSQLLLHHVPNLNMPYATPTLHSAVHNKTPGTVKMDIVMLCIMLLIVLSVVYGATQLCRDSAHIQIQECEGTPTYLAIYMPQKTSKHERWSTWK